MQNSERDRESMSSDEVCDRFCTSSFRVRARNELVLYRIPSILFVARKRTSADMNRERERIDFNCRHKAKLPNKAGAPLNHYENQKLARRKLVRADQKQSIFEGKVTRGRIHQRQRYYYLYDHKYCVRGGRVGQINR